jgi:hypothetical protein
MTADKAKAKPPSTLPWSVSVAIADIPEGGKRFDLIADETTRAEVAQIAGLRSLPRLQARFDVARHGSDGLRVNGEISATVGQNCVVTLDPIDNEIMEDVNLVFMPPPAPAMSHDGAEEVDLVDPDDPEPLIGGTVDLGAVATEFLIVGIDPYPRKPGATFDHPVEQDESAHPFAALAALKKNPEAKE